MKNIGKRIRAFRLANDLTQFKASFVLGVSLPTISRLESGTTVGTELTRARIEKRMANFKERKEVAA